MNIIFIIGLLFIILISVFLYLLFKNPYIVSGIIAILSLTIFAIFIDTLGLTFIIWVFIYTILAFISALITCRYTKHRNFNDDF